MSGIKSLAGKTLFITGASRGIGLSIALRAAQDGANVVIAAKTSEAHPKLPGTVYTAAEAIEKAGGKALPCIVDIRSELQVEQAIEAAVGTFGGIDILVNNASAINLVDTETLTMKSYDLMHQINARGTFLCSKFCIPHLKQAPHAHILNISPPLSLNQRWFKDHVGYTMAKYGMSLCVLGMAPELAKYGIAVNALWPRTAIYTAAMKMLAGDHVAEQCRRPEIMADAAHVLLCKDPRTFSGQFCVDEDLLRRECGFTDAKLEEYSCVPGGKLLPDFFLDDAVADGQWQETVQSPAEQRQQQQQQAEQAAPATHLSELDAAMQRLADGIDADAVGVARSSATFELTDVNRIWLLDLRKMPGSLKEVKEVVPADATMKLTSAVFKQLMAGEISATAAFMAGKLKISGNLGVAMKIERLFRKTIAKL